MTDRSQPARRATHTGQRMMCCAAVTCALSCNALVAQTAPQPYSALPLSLEWTNPASGPTTAAPPFVLTGLPELAAAPSASLLTASNAPDEASLEQKLQTARHHRLSRETAQAEPLLIELLGEVSTESIKQAALLELAALAHDDQNVARALQTYSQFLTKWPNDLRVPEVLLRQGQLFRQMGLNSLALTKFYAVMTSALILKNDRMAYYVQLVHQAQVEIAETHYALGKYAEAADFYRRLLKQTNSVSKSQMLYRLARCHFALAQYSETVAGARTFLEMYPTAAEQPEIRFYLAVALKELGRDNEALQQVLLLLQEQREVTRDRPALWAYWQQRAGNLVANHLYREGDYTKALEIYLRLAELDPSPSWRLPVNYQVGITYERLWQPRKAIEVYQEILRHEKELNPTASPGMKTVFDMARWRTAFIEWQEKAEQANRRLHDHSLAPLPDTASLPLQPPPGP